MIDGGFISIRLSGTDKENLNYKDELIIQVMKEAYTELFTGFNL